MRERGPPEAFDLADKSDFFDGLWLRLIRVKDSMIKIRFKKIYFVCGFKVHSWS